MNNDFLFYEKLLKSNYYYAVLMLLKKYGNVKYDYFIREDSYNNLIKGNIKNLIKNKNVSMTSNDGLFCHHIQEIKYYNLSSKKALIEQKPSYDSQKAKNLVYCNLIEHAILHALIKLYGKNINSNPDQLINNIKDWYIDCNFPQKKDYLKQCYKASYLNKKEASRIYQEILDKLN